MAAPALSVDEKLKAPSLALLLAEAPRALLERLTLPSTSPLLMRAPRGDGHTVLVLPGFMAGDASTRLLRRYLRNLGYAAQPWSLGRNLGIRGNVRERIAERVTKLHSRAGAKISIVGWSLGGIYAREIAKEVPDAVRQVITLGSPFAAANRPTNASDLFHLLSDPISESERVERAEGLRTPPPMPSTAIYSKTDGVVPWESCLERDTHQTQNIQVPGSHCGLGFNSLAYFAIADRLSQGDGSWRPFDLSGWRRHAYK